MAAIGIPQNEAERKKLVFKCFYLWLPAYLLAIASLGHGLYAAIAFFLGTLPEQSYHNLLMVSTLSWFVFATMWANRKPKA